jgi:hypothetical protein
MQDLAQISRDSRFRRTDSKYWGINLTTKSTVEFRIFRGTLTAEGILTNIGFVQSLYEYTYPSGVGVSDVNTEDYMRYVKANKKRFPELHAHLWEKLPDVYSDL